MVPYACVAAHVPNMRARNTCTGGGNNRGCSPWGSAAAVCPGASWWLAVLPVHVRCFGPTVCMCRCVCVSCVSRALGCWHIKSSHVWCAEIGGAKLRPLACAMCGLAPMCYMGWCSLMRTLTLGFACLCLRPLQESNRRLRATGVALHAEKERLDVLLVRLLWISLPACLFSTSICACVFKHCGIGGPSRGSCLQQISDYGMNDLRTVCRHVPWWTIMHTL